MRKGQVYRLNIINCEKTNSQFNYGMQPLLYSTREAEEGRPGWTRAGTRITYYKNNFYWDPTEREKEGRRERGKGEKDGGKGEKRKGYHTLSFSLSFPHSGDHCYLAYHYPYSYSMLMVSMCMVVKLWNIWWNRSAYKLVKTIKQLDFPGLKQTTFPTP